MMWMLTTNRREFVELLTSKAPHDVGTPREFHGQLDLPSDASDRLTLLWRDRPKDVGQAPSVIVLADKARRDFLAWIVTYVPDYRPFTSFFRLVSPDVATRYLDGPSLPVVNSLDACLGLILAEAATYAAASHEAKQLTPVSCASTCSYVTARSIASSCSPSEVEQIQTAWFRARTITRQAKLPLGTDQLQAPWRVLLATSSGKRRIGSADVGDSGAYAKILHACGELQDQSELSPYTLSSLFGGIERFEPRMLQSARTREEKVATYETFLRSVMSTARVESLEAAFCLGYLVSQIAPGTLDHLQLLTPTIGVFPTAPLWYGLIAGLSKVPRLQSIGNGLGRRVMRDILAKEDFLSQPRCDIALAELEMLMASEVPHTDIRVGAQGHLEVELMPCVNTLLRWPVRPEASGDLFGSRPTIMEAQEVMTELNDVLARAELLRSRLSSVLNLPPDPRRGKPDRKGRR